MNSQQLGIALSSAAVIILVPLIMKFWGRLSPPGQYPEFRSFSKETLIRRNNWIDQVGIVLSLVGLCAPLYLYFKGASNQNPWPVGLGFGLMVILPITFYCFVTLPKGLSRFREFWFFYQQKYGVGKNGLLAVFLPIASLGFISSYKLLF